jgi:hypothetical protein
MFQFTSAMMVRFIWRVSVRFAEVSSEVNVVHPVVMMDSMQISVMNSIFIFPDER